uniref:Uncharacterized protein n=1 Tax=Anguilla anguilla TaxID=7936 RepID=A0A0E9WSB8_ANGAN
MTIQVITETQTTLKSTNICKPNPGKATNICKPNPSLRKNSHLNSTHFMTKQRSPRHEIN